MTRPFQGHIVEGRAVTTKDGMKAGIIKSEPKETTKAELEELEKTQEMIAGAVEKAKAEYPQMEIIIDNETFIEWSKELFSSANCPDTRKLYVYSEETAQMLVDRGVPIERIEVIGPLPKKKKQ